MGAGTNGSYLGSREKEKLTFLGGWLSGGCYDGGFEKGDGLAGQALISE